MNVHQLRAGHWGYSEQYLHRIGRRPITSCHQCDCKACPAARCTLCREGADTPEHVMLRCPCLTGARFRATGNIHVSPERLRDGGLVATFAAGYLPATRSPSRGYRPVYTGPDGTNNNNNSTPPAALSATISVVPVLPSPLLRWLYPPRPLRRYIAS